ncbi:MAG: hypothetical protein AAGG50_03010 [Bacteroidota bacterium]
MPETSSPTDTRSADTPSADVLSAFEAQFESDATRAEAVEEVRDAYLMSLAYQVEDPITDAIEFLLETYEYDLDPTPADVERIVEAHRDEIQRELPFKRREVQDDLNAERFFELRREGRTVAAIARTLGVEPGYLAHIASRADYLELKRTGVKLARSIRQEEAEAKAYRARMRLLSKLSKKVETALESRDFSDVPTENLVGLMLKLADLTREETPPSLSVYVDRKQI